MSASFCRNFSTPWPFSAEIMKVSAKASRAFRSAARPSSFSCSIVSILLITRIFGAFSCGRRSRIASASSSTPLRASISRQTTSASPAPPQAEVTMARSSRRLGAKMPGVSTKMICAAPSSAMPRTRARVVWTLRDTIETLAPTNWLSRVDLPALGAPISAQKPQRGACASSFIRHPPRRARGSGISARWPVRRSASNFPARSRSHSR